MADSPGLLSDRRKNGNATPIPLPSKSKHALSKTHSIAKDPPIRTLNTSRQAAARERSLQRGPQQSPPSCPRHHAVARRFRDAAPTQSSPSPNAIVPKAPKAHPSCRHRKDRIRVPRNSVSPPVGPPPTPCASRTDFRRRRSTSERLHPLAIPLPIAPPTHLESIQIHEKTSNKRRGGFCCDPRSPRTFVANARPTRARRGEKRVRERAMPTAIPNASKAPREIMRQTHKDAREVVAMW